MARLKIYLLGPFRVVLDGRPVTEFPSNKVRALLALLAAESDRPWRREHLATLLWPKSSDKQHADTSLRTALTSLRDAIGDEQAVPPFLQVSRETLQFNLASDSWIDLVAFARLLPASIYPEQPDSQDISQWEKAVELYRGPFLEGFAIANNLGFDEWALPVRAFFEEQLLGALEHLVEWHEAHGQVQPALQHAKRQVALDPLRESAHRQLMRLYARSGRTAEALAQYKELRRVLKTELSAKPDELTRELHRQIRAGEVKATPTFLAPRLPYEPPELPDPDTLPEAGLLPPGSRVPFIRNALFTGRREPLLALGLALLHDPTGPALVTQAVTGMGGIGKTHLAVEFCYRYGRYTHGVHWVNAAEPGGIAAEVAACGQTMCLPAWPDSLPDQVALTLWTWAGAGPRLVVLDNLEDMQTASEWLSRLGSTGVRLLVTARRSKWLPEFGLMPLHLTVFSPAESRTYLRHYVPTSRTPEADLDRLTERLGHLPLALKLAGSYLEQDPGLAPMDYVDRLEGVLDDPSMRAWGDEWAWMPERDRDLAASFALSWKWVSSAAAQRVFIIAGYCAPNEPIPSELLGGAAGLSAEGCEGAVRSLVGLSLMERGKPQAGPTVHPLLAEWARGPAVSLLPDGEAADTLLPALAGHLASLAHEATESLLPGRFVPLRSHVEVVAGHAEAARLDVSGALWNELARYRRMTADYSGARDSVERALRIDEAAFGPEHPKVATDVNDLGNVLQDMGDLAGARAAYERALRIDEEALGPEHPNVARDVNDLGSALQDLDDLAGARALYERALSIDEAALGPEHLAVARDLNNLGLLLRGMGEPAAARAALERAMPILERAYGPEHPRVAIAWVNLGLVMKDLRDLAGAWEAFGRALRIDEITYGPDHPEVATDLNNLGRVLHSMGDMEAARALFERSLRIDEATLGPEHLQTALCLHNLGSLLEDVGDKDGARLAYERALAIRIAKLPPDHPYLQQTRRKLEGLG